MLTHKGTVTLTTPRLTLRRLTAADAPAMYANWCSDQKVTKFLRWDPHPSEEHTRELLESWVTEYERADYYHWVIEYAKYIIGTIAFHAASDNHERLEIGYCIGSRWWNRGIVTEALGAALRYAFEELNAHRMIALHDTQNPGSGRVMQKNGMKLEGILREHLLRKDGSRGDMAYYAILRSEWGG
ncbi:MAG: GNAT family N-acetyltransferase [Oscillospiraceae bacterium]|nr:GNAT family N-acetyltransferase [Oscillospiraceae bacterium]